MQVKSESKTEMVAPVAKLVRMKALRDVIDHNRKVVSIGQEFETTEEHANELSTPIKGHYAFEGERFNGRGVENHEFIRAVRI
jgi:hypothetical protein